ncbi:uncharacterized protein BDR25DRAFT_39860 [Lindgomyces ingoldianus]|uniref:Uncharacterized protein n=1 Tax=Lindgomyces ingoldianus TaxID=673940 RepID=A0ACB6QS41_9PLEO|nr:uncharacterized protein BDR25DRAFT_39860 [Lindgomyces ingoldianus]KAF2469809.1 hypothetical protein BDR25DRAFT_39860 [Lindgomyces ingoldianus]
MAQHDDNSLASRGRQQANVAIAFLVLAWVFVALRVWTRIYVIANFGWDDRTMILATMIFTVYCAAMFFLEAHGGGTHVTSVAQMIKLIKWTIVGEATYLLTILVLKISLGIFFSRIIVKRWQAGTIWITVGISILSGTSSLFYVFFRCGANLNHYVYRQLENKCTSRGLDRFFAYQQASFTTLTDCIFATLPIFILWNSGMDTRSKISVGLILSLAALGCICSIIRFQYVDGLTQIEDFYWNATNVAIWSTVEPGSGIVAGCLATLRPFLKRFITTARSVRSATAKQLSRSLRSSEPGSDSKCPTESNMNHTAANRSCRNTNDAFSKHGESFELKSEANRKDGESTDYILTQTDEFDGSWAAQQSRGNLALDRRSTRTSGGLSGTHSMDPLWPPIPTQGTSNDEIV